jgi:hypothetical protein
MEWLSVDDDFPDWRDGGRAEFRRADGSTVFGDLSVDDCFFNGEEEVPIFKLKLDDGTVADIFSFAQYRLAKPD